MNKKLYVGNLLYEVGDEDLKELFAQAGGVTSASVIRYHDSGRSKGFAFVEMDSEEAAQKAMDMFSGQDFKGRKLVVSEARPPKPRTFDGNGGGNGYGNRDNNFDNGNRNNDNGFQKDF